MQGRFGKIIDMVTVQTTTVNVAIVRTFEGVEEAAHRVIAQIGGMASVLNGARTAILKPNLVAGRDASTGATTSFALMKAVAEEVRACGAEPLLCEMPGTEFDREATYTILGLEQFCAEQGIRIARVDPEGGDQDWVEVRAHGARRLRRFHIPRILQDACLINLPVLKTHVVSTMTLGMKNIMGVLPRPDRRAMHTLGIDQCIVDMNYGLRPALTIVDGSVGQDGEGPLYGEAAHLQVLVAGCESLAVDLACCQLVGISPRQVPHLRLALKQMGQPVWRPTGEEISMIKQFRLPEQKPLYRLLFWLMYPLDYPYTWLAERGKHLCTTLYSTGLVGTRPQIKQDECTRCGECVKACPLPNVIDLETLKVNYKTCQRCLLCYEACPEQAINVQGYSGARR
jgi:uncharacterized protein (DUF362 family)/Pyruvate/2-oxoacid:ferredoxin oxidoreductase delta subunit